MYDFSFLEIELTTKCNASCPQCPRNYYGGSVWSSLPLVDIDIKKLQHSLEPTMHKINLIRLCGTYGDPILHPNMIEFVKWAKTHNCQISISTNGGARTEKWWQELASVLDDNDRVYFGIDGLEDTNHLYRRGVNFTKLIKNVNAFNAAGGKSIWQMIVFEHNQHQVNTAEELSVKLGFLDFVVKKTSRFVNKKHDYVDSVAVHNRDNATVEYFIKPPTISKYLNDHLEYRRSNQVSQTAEIDCMAISSKMVYISAEGYVFPCGFLSDRLYGPESEEVGEPEFLNLINSQGGLDTISLWNHSLDTIVSGPVFAKIAESWGENPLARCANQCDKHHHLVGSSTENLQKTWKQT